MRIGKAEPENREVVREVLELLESIGAVDLAELVAVDSKHQAALSGSHRAA